MVNLIRKIYWKILKYYFKSGPLVEQRNLSNAIQLIKNREIKVSAYAEIGTGWGDTVLKVCEFLEPNSSIYIFDYEDVVGKALEKIESKFPGKFKVYKFGNSRKERDSYCWNLIHLIRQNLNNKIFDYVYLDGSHDLVVDGFTFYLVNLLLKKGGYLEFDDYEWTFLNSPCNPKKYPKTAKNYTSEQMAIPQIKLIIDNLVKTNINYKEIIKNRVYQKI